MAYKVITVNKKTNLITQDNTKAFTRGQINIS